MLSLIIQRIVIVLLLGCAACAQIFSVPTSASRFGTAVALDAIETGEMNFTLFTINSQAPNGTLVQSPSASVSQFDLRAPGKARREYERGYQLLQRKDLQAATEHLRKAVALYPKFVAAHNALGTAYLDLHQDEQARDEFSKAVALDDHLPNSCLNLGIAQLALKDYAGAEKSLQKATSIAPLDLQLSTAAAYADFANRDYPAVIATSHEVHERKHAGAALVHFFAAGAWQAQNNLSEAQHEMELLLQEETSPASRAQFEQILDGMKMEQSMQAEAKAHPPQTAVFAFNTAGIPTAAEASQHAKLVLQTLEEKNQIADAEAAPDPSCAECGTSVGADAAAPTLTSHAMRGLPGATFRASVDEVALFFTATEHGKSVTDLSASNVALQDDRHAPDAILSFRNETQLPLRLGLVIDTSNSVTERLPFEQAAANRFLKEVVTGKDDLAFVVGVNNSVLLVQDFTSDLAQATRGVSQLAAGGGTALWDAVAFTADKLARREENGPVARIVVVISDGQDNSSGVTLKEAIQKAQRGEVAVYTVSTKDDRDGAASSAPEAEVGHHALRTLSDLTGGTSLAPGSVKHLSHSLAALQELIRGRYLISYKPASFRRDGRYRTIDLTAQKDGRTLKVFARKGYYAAITQPVSNTAASNPN
jgi:Ca-activated chloride channel homolog